MQVEDTGEAEYLQLARTLRQRIIDGELAVGDRLPSSRQVLDAHGIGRATYGRAIAELRRQGLVQMRRGQGAWVAARPAVATVQVRPGDRVTARAPAPGERDSLGTGPLSPVLVVTRRDGTQEAYAAAVTVCLVTGPLRSRLG